MLAQAQDHTGVEAQCRADARALRVAGRQGWVADPSPVEIVRDMIVRVVRGSTHNFALRVGDWLLASTLASLGFILSQDPAAVDGNPAYDLMQRIAPTANFGFVCMAVGFVRLTALFINGTFRAFRFSPHVRFMMSMVSIFVWFQLALGAALAPTVTIALAIYPNLCLFDFYNTFLAAAEAGAVERRYRNGWS